MNTQIAMKNLLMVGTLLVGLSSMQAAFSALQPVNDTQLQQVEGQAGIFDATATSISMGLVARYNLNADGTNICASGVVNCNIGLSFNNRYIAGTVGNTPTNLKQWLVFKNVTGGINIPQLNISTQAVDISTNSTQNLRQALTFSLSDANPIQFTHVGFESLAGATDTQAEVGTAGAFNSLNVAGYRDPTLSTQDANNKFDAEKLSGFVGLEMTASVAVNGNIKIFNCNTGPRCS